MTRRFWLVWWVIEFCSKHGAIVNSFLRSLKLSTVDRGVYLYGRIGDMVWSVKKAVKEWKFVLHFCILSSFSFSTQNAIILRDHIEMNIPSFKTVVTINHLLACRYIIPISELNLMLHLKSRVINQITNFGIIRTPRHSSIRDFFVSTKSFNVLESSFGSFQMRRSCFEILSSRFLQIMKLHSLDPHQCE